MDKLLARSESKRRALLSTSGGPTFGESVVIPSDVPPEAGPTPVRIPEYPAFKGRFFQRLKEIDGPLKLAREILLASPLDEYLDAGKKADEFTDKMIREGIITEGNKDRVYNALHHFLAAYTVTREYVSPRLTWTLGVLNEMFISPITGRLAGSTKEEIARDSEIDYYHNQLGIEEAVKHSGRDVQLYELVKRLVLEGKFRY